MKLWGANIQIKYMLLTYILKTLQNKHQLSQNYNETNMDYADKEAVALNTLR